MIQRHQLRRRLLSKSHLSCRQKRSISHFRIIEHLAPTQHVRSRAGGIDPETKERLKLCVKQYVPLDNENAATGDVTVIGAHANAFPKEMYEPLWDDLYEKLRNQGRKIRGIWIADVSHQNASGVVNETILGNDPHWWDHSLDLLYFINQHQEQMPLPLIAIGHSLGASQLAYLSLMHPSLFQALILMEPVITTKNLSMGWNMASTYRRETWPSRSAAAAKFSTSKFYQSWDSRILQQWVTHGLRDMPTLQHPLPSSTPQCPPTDDNSNSTAETPVTLTTPVNQEVYTFLRAGYENSHLPHAEHDVTHEISPDDPNPEPFYRPEPAELTRRLPDLRPDTTYIFGSTSEVSSPGERAIKLTRTGTGIGGNGGTTAGRVREFVLDGGHLVPFQDVGKCADIAARVVDSEVRRWEDGRREHGEFWAGRAGRGRGGVDAEWKRRLGAPPARTKVGGGEKL